MKGKQEDVHGWGNVTKECGVPRTLLGGTFSEWLELVRLVVRPELLLTDSATLCKLLHVSEPSLPVLRNKTSHSTCLSGRLRRGNKVTQEGTWL